MRVVKGRVAYVVKHARPLLYQEERISPGWHKCY